MHELRAPNASTLVVATRTLARELPGLSPALLIVALLACLLLPLPTPIVDLLLSLSLAGALLLLVAGLRVARAAEFSSFPTLVLLAALYRLALNVSTTRLILSEADAGRVIDAFAELVVRGDLLIGAVMFAVITAIQYLVVARGAERVAEVAARFALDGMPGKQAAIDADLRAGTINPREARERRVAIGEQSEFFGRMDGVMRWIRGDTIVGLLITAINLVGGLAVGATRSGLGLGESLELYGKLAIGDGLLAQIPALLIALAAAVLVARIDGVGEQSRRRWLEPGMLLVPALLLGLLAAVPGMPTLAFLTCAVGLVVVALTLSGDRPPPAPELEPEIRVRAHVEHGALADLAKELVHVRTRCEGDLAIPVPRLVLEPVTGTDALGVDEFELRLGERVLGRARAEGQADRDALVLGCYQLLLDGAERLVTLEQIESELELVRRRRPTLVRQAMRVIEPVDVLAIVRGIVRERIPAPRMETLLEVLAERRVFQDLDERANWPEHAREALADTWLRDLCDAVVKVSKGRLSWLRPSADFEDALLARARAGGRGVDLALSEAERRQMIDELFPGEGRHVIVTSARARGAFASLIAGVRPYVHVLAITEFDSAGLPRPACGTVELA